MIPMLNRRKITILLMISISLFLSGCGGKNTGTSYEIVDGKIIEVQGKNSTDDVAGLYTENENMYMGQEVIAGEGAYDGAVVGDGVKVSTSSSNPSDSSGGASNVEINSLKSDMKAAAKACKDVYLNADKGDGWNVDLSSSTIAEMMSAIASEGFSAIDSNNSLNMQGYEALDEFGITANIKGQNVTGEYFVVYPDGHLSAFKLVRQKDAWHLISMSASWEDDGDIKIYSEGKYSVGEVKYTNRGWLIYSRDTSTLDENQKSNTSKYSMVRVLPYNANYKQFAQKYISKIGYLENNLFTTNWSISDYSPIDFNSLYAYIFGMYNGTDMLSSYNVRSYYSAIGNTRLYLIPTATFENNVKYYFDIDELVLRNISDYSGTVGGYFFIGYNSEYYNVTPRTPTPEVTNVTYNNDGTISLTVDAVNAWYGTDKAFEHILTVRNNEDGSFTYISNTLIDSNDNIIPETKLSELLNVEKSKIKY